MNTKKRSTNKTHKTKLATTKLAPTKLIVISHGGKLVGTQLPAMPVEPNAYRATVVAGPGQRLHEIEIEDAEGFHQRRAIAELHALVRKKLKLK